MGKTKQRKKRKLDPRLWSTLGVAAAMLLILVCVFVFMEAADASRTAAKQATVPVQTRDIPYEPEDFVLGKQGFMECVTNPYSTGIDVSSYQGQIDWQAVKAEGVDFVFIRIGYRGSTEGALYADESAQSYYEGAKAAGLQVGAYFFSQSVSVEEAVEEAEFSLSLVEGWELDLPIVYDWEYIDKDARTGKMKRKTLTECTLAFCQTIEKAGQKPMIYFNESQGQDLLYLDQLQQYPFWLAKYSGALDFPYQVDYWQYTETGKVDGISGGVDLNIFIAS